MKVIKTVQNTGLSLLSFTYHRYLSIINISRYILDRLIHMKKWMFILSLFMISVFISACGNEAPTNEEVENENELIISAAISLTDALDEVKNLYQKNNNTEITFNFGGDRKSVG